MQKPSSFYIYTYTHVCIYKILKIQTKLSLLVAFCSQTGTPATWPDLWPPPWEPLWLQNASNSAWGSKPFPISPLPSKKEEREDEVPAQHLKQCSASPKFNPCLNSDHPWVLPKMKASAKPLLAWLLMHCRQLSTSFSSRSTFSANPFKVCWLKKKWKNGFVFFIKPRSSCSEGAHRAAFLVLTDLHEPGWRVRQAVVWVRDCSTAC